MVHQNANMVREAEATEKIASTLTTVVTSRHYQPIGSTNLPLQYVGHPLARRTETAKRRSKDMIVVLGTAGFGEVEQTIMNIGHAPIVAMAMEPNPVLNRTTEERLDQSVYGSTEAMSRKLHHSGGGMLSVDVHVAMYHNVDTKQTHGRLSVMKYHHFVMITNIWLNIRY